MPQPQTRARTTRVAATGGGAITRTTLPSGLRIVSEAMPSVRSASIGVWVPVGSRHESTRGRGREPLSRASTVQGHDVAHGAGHRDRDGRTLAASSTRSPRRSTPASTRRCSIGDLPLAVDIVIDVVLNATVTAQDVDVERSVVLEEIAMRDDDPADLVHDEFASTLFGDTPLGRPILGSITSITALRRAQVAGYYHRRYRPRDMVVAVAGNVDHAAVVRRVRTAFDSADGSRCATQTARRQDQSRPAPRATIVGDETEQANIVLGTQGISRLDDRRFTPGCSPRHSAAA